MSEYIEAVNILKKVLTENKHLDECMDGDASGLSKQICYGAVRQFYYLDCVIEKLVDKPLPEKHLDIWLLLLTGLYSMENLHRPAHASVNNCVDATIKLDKPWAKGLVNAVLRRYGREADKLKVQLSGVQEAALNHPQWLCTAIKKDWPDNPEIFDCNNIQAPMSLRVNLSRTTRNEYLELLANDGIEARAGLVAPSAVVLSTAIAVQKLPGFVEGLVSVQDESPQMAPTFMHLEPGQTVLDACAAPGGKTCHILEYEPSCKLTALDRDRKRIHRIQENLNRLSLNATVVTSDLEKFESSDGFDRVLLDVPCSATGIIRRHPDIKLLRKKSDIAKLSLIQRVLLEKAFSLLRTGGELLYSTCSILHQENDEVISEFLQKNSQSSSVPLEITQKITEQSAKPSIMATQYGVQFLPTKHDHDGFYYAAIRKVSA
jgi:16S rRNA (cytosine967-C5)-methyltransferase